MSVTYSPNSPNSKVQGDWTGNLIDGTHGGTGVNNGTNTFTINGNVTVPAYVQGDLLYASSSSALSALAKSATATRYLTNTGTTNNPAWGQVNLANGVSGNLAVTSLNSGSSASSSTYWRGDGTWASVSGGTVTTVSVATANGVSGTVANATTTPAITLVLGAITPTTIVASGAVSGSNLSGSNTGDQTITLTGNVTGTGTGSFATTIAASAVTNAMLAGSIDLTAKVTGALPIVSGGSGQTTAITSFNALSPLTTQGDIIYYNGTNNVRLAAGTDTYVLTTHGAGANPTWAAAAGGGGSIATVRVISGATTLTSADYGTTIICTGTVAYTVKLPTVISGNNNLFIRIINSMTTNALITLDAVASPSFSGASAYYLGWQESVTMKVDNYNATYLPNDRGLYHANISANRSGGLSLTSGAATDLVYDTRVYDAGVDTPNGNFFSTSNGKWAPLYAGLYFVTATCALSAPTAGTTMSIQLNLTGTNKNLYTSPPIVSGDLYVSVSGFFKLDGVSDYIKAVVTQTGTTGGSVILGTTATTFLGYRINEWWN